MLTVTFTSAKLAEIQRVDPASGSLKFHCALGKGYEKLFERMGWQVPEDKTMRLNLEGKLEGGHFVLTSKDKLVDAEIELGFKAMSGFHVIRMELEGRKGKGFRRELRFDVTFEEVDALARLESYMMTCDNAYGSLGVKYLAEPVQEVIPETQLELYDDRRKATSKDAD